jgi:hypothetical protein
MKTADGIEVAGEAVFRILVEYTGEVYRVEVVESSGLSHQFHRKMIDMIMDTDFVGWVPTDTDTEFLYPLVVQP